MTNEEAIVQLEIDATNLVGRLASEPVHDTSFSELWKRKLEAIDIAIYAIKMFDKHEVECERCACNLLAERDALKEEKLISNADVAEVVHGRWVFTAYSFYRDEDFPDGVAYVTANCSECGGKHPNYAEVYHKTILRPDEYDCVDGWEFDEEAEQRLALEEAEKRRDRLSPYCPNCGAKMDKEDET